MNVFWPCAFEVEVSKKKENKKKKKKKKALTAFLSQSKKTRDMVALCI